MKRKLQLRDCVFGTIAFVSTLFVELIIFIWFLNVKFCNEYEHCQYWGDCDLRIPLWYPYELHGRNASENVALDDWRLGKEDGVELVSYKPGKQSSPGTINGVQAELHFLEDIVDFQISTNVLCGLRKVRSHRGGLNDENNPVLATRYFLFATNMSSFVYFEDEETYLKKCALYGIDGNNRRSFEEYFNEFCSRRDEQRTIDNLLGDLSRNPLNKAERNLLIVFMTVPLLCCVVIAWFYRSKPLVK